MIFRVNSIMMNMIKQPKAKKNICVHLKVAINDIYIVVYPGN